MAQVRLIASTRPTSHMGFMAHIETHPVQLGVEAGLGNYFYYRVRNHSLVSFTITYSDGSRLSHTGYVEETDDKIIVGHLSKTESHNYTMTFAK